MHDFEVSTDLKYYQACIKEFSEIIAMYFNNFLFLGTNKFLETSVFCGYCLKKNLKYHIRKFTKAISKYFNIF